MNAKFNLNKKIYKFNKFINQYFYKFDYLFIYFNICLNLKYILFQPLV